jgi:hypothetical protein
MLANSATVGSCPSRARAAAIAAPIGYSKALGAVLLLALRRSRRGALAARPVSSRWLPSCLAASRAPPRPLALRLVTLSVVRR